MNRKRKITKIHGSAGIVTPQDGVGAPDADFDTQMQLAETIMREDSEVLRTLAQVMRRRKRALRELAK